MVDHVTMNLLLVFLGILAGVMVGLCIASWFIRHHHEPEAIQEDMAFWNEKPKRKVKNGESALKAARLRISEDGELIPEDEWEDFEDEKLKRETLRKWPITERSIPIFPAYPGESVSHHVRAILRHADEQRTMQFISLTTKELHALEQQEADEETAERIQIAKNVLQRAQVDGMPQPHQNASHYQATK